jgi:peroxiredoxin
MLTEDRAVVLDLHQGRSLARARIPGLLPIHMPPIPQPPIPLLRRPLIRGIPLAEGYVKANRRPLIPFLAVPLAFIAVLIAVRPAAALEPGSAAPAFTLEWLSEEGTISSDALFAQSPMTVLIVWNRGCPRCTKIALGIDGYAESLESSGIRTVGVLFGPDDVAGLNDLLWDNEVAIPHLWDPDGRMAAAYGLGFQHLGIFAIDRTGTVRASFDDKVEDLDSTIPAIRRAAAEGPVSIAADEGERTRVSPPINSPALNFPALQIDGRLKVLSAAGVHGGDTGFYTSSMENGSLFLYRWDLRTVWPVAKGIDFIPWLRVSNEPDEVLSEGAEQLSSVRGTASLRARFDTFTGIAGAFPLRLSPLSLQRWDAADSPPLGGTSGCGCGAGASGLIQRSLEVLTPFYTFEGLTAEYAQRPFHSRLRAFGAIPRWEQSGTGGRYRRALGGGAIDFGLGHGVDPATDLSSPVGVRLGYLDIGDDRRTLLTVTPPVAQHEWSYIALARLGPLWGITADGEVVDWREETKVGVVPPTKVHETGLRAGIRADERRDAISFWADVHRIRTDSGFEPLYRALTYSPNQDGWRMSGGLRLHPSPTEQRERVSISVFRRAVRQTELLLGADRKARTTVSSVDLAVRPVRDLIAQAHALRLETESPLSTGLTDRTDGISFDLRWEGIAALDPLIRIDRIEEKAGTSAAHTLWEGYLMLRVVR